MSKSEYRNKIDEIDKQIVQLFGDRMKLAAEIANYKKEHNEPVFDSNREREVINSIIKNSPDEIKEYTPLLYSLMFELSRSYQKKLNGVESKLIKKIERAIENTPQMFPDFATVACQGTVGAYSQVACDKLFKHADIKYYSHFEDVFKAIDEGECQYGVIPIENSTAGSVNAVYDLMMDHKFCIVRSMRLKVDHSLLVKPGTKMEDITEIFSHEQALNQSAEFLKSMNVKATTFANTAMAAKMVSESERNDIAALSSHHCMKHYNLKCLKQSVQDNDNNYTRFICITKKLQIYPGAFRTSVMLSLPDEPGALYKLLLKLYALEINLTKLESRPLPNSEFQFMFYFDLEAQIYSPKLLQLIEELEETCDVFTYLGSYSEVPV